MDHWWPVWHAVQLHTTPHHNYNKCALSLSWDQTCCSCCSVSHNVLTVRISRALQIFLCVGTFLYNFMVKWKFSKKQVPGAGKCGHRRSLYLTSFIGNQLQFGQFAWFPCSIITDMVLLFYTLNTQVSSLSSLLGNR